MLDPENKVTPELAAEHGLTAEEYARIRKILGRDPNFTELGIFSVMWSEHCSYKSSKAHLRRLPTRAPQVLQGPGENAGVVDIGDGLAAAFKMESHNHPSYVEPFQGAATGVGGILRDIFTMGARPIAVLDSLRFGPITSGTSGAKAPSSVSAEMSRLKPRPTNTASGENLNGLRREEVLDRLRGEEVLDRLRPEEDLDGLRREYDLDRLKREEVLDGLRPGQAGPEVSETTSPAADGSFATDGSRAADGLVGRGFSRDISVAQNQGALAPEAIDEEIIARNRRILDGVVRGIA